MNKTAWIMVIAGVGGLQGLSAEGGGAKMTGTPWNVHDMARPTPPLVATKGAVSVPAPGDAVVLFDGKDLAAWRDPKWIVRDGILIAAEADLTSLAEFGDCQVHVEWRVPVGGKGGKGGKGGNSGVFLMDRYEIQVFESFKDHIYADGQAGSIYGQSPPLVNACVPQGEWQSYDIIFEAPVYEGKAVKKPARVTVLHNGVLLHHAKELLGPMQHMKLATYPEDHPAKAPLRLQFHGDPIEYRNIWIREAGAYDSAVLPK
jgi:hypothetical protein